MQILNKMAEYCERLFESDAPKSMAMYQALLPAVLRCEIALGDTIECETEDLVKTVANFMRTFMDDEELTREQLNVVVNDTIEFIVQAILTQRKE